MNFWRTIYRISWALFAVLAISGLLYIFVPQCRSISRLQKQKKLRAEKNENTEREISALKTKRDRFTSDPAFVERTAREMGMIKPGEVMYRFKEEDATSPQPGGQP